MSEATVRAGITDALADIPGLSVYGFVSLMPTTPCAVVAFASTLDPGQYMGQPGTIYQIPITVYVGLSDDKQADITLTGLVDDVLDALDAAPTLSGACSSANVLTVDDLGRGPLGDGGPEVLGRVVNLEIYS